jgi:GNAT superfamily N-acetyltransferase
MTYALIHVQSPEDWLSYHDIRRNVLFEGKGRHGVYDDKNADEYKDGHYPLLLKFHGRAIGTTRLDNFGDGTGAIRLVAIIESEQGRGHGRILSNLVDAFARSIGISTLLVNAAPEALGYYERVGWAKHVWNPAELRGIATDCIQMRRSI